MNNKDDTDKELITVAEEKNKVLQKARIEMNELTGDAAVRRLAELREKWERDRISEISYAEEKGKAIGEEIGKRQGNEEKAREIAKNMIKRNMKIEDIIEITGLTKEEIESLK